MEGTREDEEVSLIVLFSSCHILAPHKRSTESLGHQRSDKYQGERHYHEKKLSKTSSSDVPVDAKETQEKPEPNADRRHSVTTSDPASGKPPKAEPPRKDSYQNQGYYGKLQNSKSMENQGYKGRHGGRNIDLLYSLSLSSQC